MYSLSTQGLSNWLHWSAWFFKCAIFVTVNVALITCLLTIKWTPRGKVIPHSDPTLVFVFLWLYGLAAISFSFMISTFFKKASYVTAASFVIWFLTYLPWGFIQQRYDIMSYGAKMATSLFLNVNMAFGCQVKLGFM